MYQTLVDVLGWSAVFIGLFILFRYLQNRKKDKPGEDE